jgi:aldehyde:ferredoxin oxidoreductase
MAKTAYVDLTASSVRMEATDETLLTHFLGGRGLGARLLHSLTTQSTDPLGPDNPLIFTTGAFTGTVWPAASRYHVTFKSPLTGIYGYANAGGFWGAELARAGYDALVITGQASAPVYLAVTNDAITVQPAGDLWGGSTSETVSAITSKRGKGWRVASIGPAGERLVLMAAILNDRGRAAARCGGGAVMGSKRLKAVAVHADGFRVPGDAFRAEAMAARDRLEADTRLDGLRQHGTPVLIAPKNAGGDLPARNHQWAQDPAAGRLEAEALEKYKVRRVACFGCPVGCSRISSVPQGSLACELEGPEYESLDALGPMTGLTDPRAVLYANHRCNELGLDTISTGVAIAFAMECRQRGLLSDERYSLNWGDVPSVLGLIESIAERDGLGDLLADGVRLAADALGHGSERYAMHVKGLELPRQEPRIAKGFGLGHAVSNRGADHLYALPTLDVAGNWEGARANFSEEMLPRLMDTADETYKPDMVVLGEHLCAVSDALGVCKFTTAETYCLGADDLARGLSALRGREVDGSDLMLAGERIVNLERMFNVRQGLSRADDRLPARFTAEPLNVWAYAPGPYGTLMPAEDPVRTGALIHLEPMLDRYYSLRGWTPDGLPTRDTLRRLGLEGLL